MHDENGPMSWTDGVEGCDFQVRSRGSVMLHLFFCCVFRRKKTLLTARYKKNFLPLVLQVQGLVEPAVQGKDLVSRSVLRA